MFYFLNIHVCYAGWLYIDRNYTEVLCINVECVCVYTMANLMNECEFGIPHSFNAFQPLKQKKNDSICYTTTFLYM